MGLVAASVQSSVEALLEDAYRIRLKIVVSPHATHLHVSLTACIVQVASPAVPRAAHAVGLFELILTLCDTAVVEGQLLTGSNMTNRVQGYCQLATRTHNHSLRYTQQSQ